MVPDVIQKALHSAPPPSQSHHRSQSQQMGNNRSNRESLQRKRQWWLPYAVLEFDKNEILIDAQEGDLANPVWKFRAHL